MKWRIKNCIIIKEVREITVLYNINDGSYYGVSGALRHFLLGHNAFEEADMINYLVCNYKIDHRTAAGDVQEFFSEIKESGIVEMVHL